MTPHGSATAAVETLLGGSFRIEKQIGQGSLGKIYRVRDVHLDRLCAIKLLRSGAGEATRAVLRHEASSLASIRSDHVVQIFGFGDHQGRPYIVMEYVEGRDLGALIDDAYSEHRMVFPLRRGVQILMDVSAGLAAIHKVGMLHRDLKPANVIVEAFTGRAVVVDFGAAIAVDRWDGVVTGTPAYMAPEVLAGEAPSRASDVYSLGCLAFELFTGRVPFEASSVDELRAQQASREAPRVSALRSELAPFDEAVARLLARDPAQRVKNATVARNLFDDRLSALQGGPAGQREGQGEDEGVRVLVIDDDPTFARVATRCVQVALADARVSVARASSGAGAVERAARRRPDLILLDYLLPDCTGLELLPALQSWGEGRAEVIVASGALGQAEQWQFGLLGVQEFICKPTEFTSFVQAIHRTAARRGWL